MAEPNEDLQAYLARIRKTISDSERVVAQAELRMAETDRMLERQGLTREQVMAMRFSDAQMEAVNAELKRRGLDPLDKWSEDREDQGQDAEDRGSMVSDFAPQEPLDSGAVSDPELENRQRKFGMMMKPFQI